MTQKFGYLGPKVIFCMVIVIFVNQYARGYNFPIRTTPKKIRFRAIWKRELRSNCPRDYAPKGSLVALVPSFYILNFPIKVRFPLLVFMYGGCFPFSPSSGQFDWETWQCLELGGGQDCAEDLQKNGVDVFKRMVKDDLQNFEFNGAGYFHSGFWAIPSHEQWTPKWKKVHH